MPLTNDAQPNTVVRINHEKCLVELRNQRLATFAADTLGGATGEVYRTLLSLLTAKLPRCRRDALIDDELGMEEQAVVTTLDVYDHLDESVNIFSGIGSTGEDKIDADSAEKIRASRPQDSDDESDSSDGPSRNANGIDADSDDSESEARSKPLNRRSLSRFNGDRTTKVQFEEDLVSTDDRLEKMRQHLLLLAESKHRFIRHCGTQSRGQWTVDFRQLLRRLRETELDAFIEQSFGRHGLRLTRILREKGKMDEKMLPAAALMKKPDVLRKMLAMQMAGLVDVQEVPKDNSRMANRTLFFWHFEGEHTQSQLLDNIYKIMLRCLLTLDVQRYNKRDILSFVERQDVQGKEEEVMTEQHYDKYNQHLEAQNKLLGQVMRLDDMVAVLRDY
jgi:DNA-directed RNA polymerase III subunit RPC3